MKPDLSRLCSRLDYVFKDYSYLKQALTHRSAEKNNNERLEFLGDSILSFIISSTLIQKYSACTEGELSRLRAFLVKGETLAEIASELGLGDFLFLGQGELKSGGYRRGSILADALEAVIAAVFLDGGIGSAEKFILHLYKSRLVDNALQYHLKDSKTSLQEWLQSRKLPLPLYTLLRIDGEEHAQCFHVSCSVEGLSSISEGMGDTRRKAEQIAAANLFSLLKNQELR